MVIRKKNGFTDIAAIDYVASLRDVRNYNTISDFIKQVAVNSVPFVPDILAFTFNLSSAHDFFQLAIAELKKLWPDTTTVAGGTHATNVTSFLLKTFPDLDYICRGEGEAIFPQFVRGVSNGITVTGRGVYNLDKIKQHKGEVRELPDHIEDLDSIPVPDFNLIDMSFYKESSGWSLTGKAKTNFPIYTTRGCPNKCTFCSAHTVHGRRVRSRSPENILAEIQQLYNEYGIRLFIPVDDLFTFKKSRVQSLLKQISDLGLKDLEFQFTNGLSVNTLDEEIMDALCEAGTTVVCLAIESGSKRVQKEIINKHVNLDKAKKVAGYLKAKGVYVHCYYIIGFPGETQHEIDQTIEFAKNIDADWAHISIATPLPGAEMFHQFADLGCIDPDDDTIWSNFFFRSRTFDTPEFSAEQINAIQQQANNEVNFFDNANMRSGKYAVAAELFRYVINRYHWHIIAWHQLYLCYKQMGDSQKQAEAEETMQALLKTDKRAIEQYNQNKDQLTEITALREQ